MAEDQIAEDSILPQSHSLLAGLTTRTRWEPYSIVPYCACHAYHACHACRVRKHYYSLLWGSLRDGHFFKGFLLALFILGPRRFLLRLCRGLRDLQVSPPGCSRLTSWAVGCGGLWARGPTRWRKKAKDCVGLCNFDYACHYYNKRAIVRTD